MALLPEIIREQPTASPDLAAYYTKYIQYDFDELKRKALQKYLRLSAPYHEQTNRLSVPGLT
jgi:hypothetical protein